MPGRTAHLASSSGDTALSRYVWCGAVGCRCGMQLATLQVEYGLAHGSGHTLPRASLQLRCCPDEGDGLIEAKEEWRLWAEPVDAPTSELHFSRFLMGMGVVT